MAIIQRFEHPSYSMSKSNRLYISRALRLLLFAVTGVGMFLILLSWPVVWEVPDTAGLVPTAVSPFASPLWSDALGA